MHTSAIADGIRAVGTGRQGSKSCTPDLARAITDDLKCGKVAPIPKAAFLGALMIKGVAPEERILAEALIPGALDSPEIMAQEVAKGAPSWMIDQCTHLLRGGTFDRATARRVGEFLFSQEPNDAARALVASVMRVRYSDPEEYAGLLDAIHSILETPFRTPVPAGAPVLQLAEPFDGVERCHLLTPLIARFFRDQGLRVVNLVGRSSGPKFGMNLRDLYGELGAPALGGNSQFAEASPEFGWVAHQVDLSPALDRWVDIRHQTIKRPFLATLEKYVNPFGSQVFVGSAFHHTFTEKMVEIAEAAEFPASIVMFKSVEGTLGLTLGRATQVMISRRRPNGTYARGDFEALPDHYGLERMPDQKGIEVSAQENARLIRNWIADGRTDNPWFNARATYSLAVYADAWSRLQKLEDAAF